MNNCTRSALPAAEEAQQQVAPRNWIPALAKVSPSSDSVWAALRSCAAKMPRYVGVQQDRGWTGKKSTSTEGSRKTGAARRASASSATLPEDSNPWSKYKGRRSRKVDLQTSSLASSQDEARRPPNTVSTI